MIRTLNQIDYFASGGASPWHRASALTKLLLAAAMVSLAVFTPSLSFLVLLHLLAWSLALDSRLPMRLLLVTAAYPLFFCGLFVVASWNGDWTSAARIVLRPLTASLTAVWLVGTTPYPDLFAPLSRVLPRGAADGLFLTYRALFGLIDRTERLLEALQLRGGTALTLQERLGVAGESIGGMVLFGFQRSQRLYATMALRGHTGRICGCRHYAELSRADWRVAVVAVLVAAAAVVSWRLP